MYEMRPGPNKSGTAVVWHVIAKRAPAALCGEGIVDPTEAAQAEQAHHCRACMASFAELMTSRSHIGGQSDPATTSPT